MFSVEMACIDVPGFSRQGGRSHRCKEDINFLCGLWVLLAFRHTIGTAVDASGLRNYCGKMSICPGVRSPGRAEGRLQLLSIRFLPKRKLRLAAPTPALYFLQPKDL